MYKYTVIHMLRCIITRKGRRKECIIDFLEQLEQQGKKSFELKKVDLTNREKKPRRDKKRRVFQIKYLALV